MAHGRAVNRLLLQVAERERALFAEELHDTLCQTLAGVCLLSEISLRRLRAGKEVTEAEAARMNDRLKGALDQSRALMISEVFAERPDLLVDKVRALAATVSDRLTCEVRADENTAVRNPLVALLIYRIVRETLHKLTRQEAATAVEIIFREAKGGIVLEIRPGKGSLVKSASLFTPDVFLERFAHALGAKWECSGKRIRCTFSGDS